MKFKCLCLYIKFYQKAISFTNLCSIYSDFHITMAELSSKGRPYGLQSLKYYLTLYRKSLPAWSKTEIDDSILSVTFFWPHTLMRKKAIRSSSLRSDRARMSSLFIFLGLYSNRNLFSYSSVAWKNKMKVLMGLLSAFPLPGFPRCVFKLPFSVCL